MVYSTEKSKITESQYFAANGVENGALGRLVGVAKSQM
jgi:hypothetical protein